MTNHSQSSEIYQETAKSSRSICLTQAHKDPFAFNSLSHQLFFSGWPGLYFLFSIHLALNVLNLSKSMSD